MTRLLPPLWFRHRGYAMVALGLTLWHLVAFADGMLSDPRRHSTAIWGPMKTLAPMWIWGLLHLFCAATIIYGVYKDNPDLHWARGGFVASISLFTFTDLSFAYAAFTNSSVAFYVMGGNVLAVLCSVAAALEPNVQEASLSSGHDQDGLNRVPV